MPETCKKIGLIARADNSGLGRLSWDFYKHLPISKVLVVSNNVYQIFPERFPEAKICKSGIPDLEEIDEFLKDIDIVLTLETPYNWNLFSEAKKRGIKTILIPNYEWLPTTLPFLPDLFLCPSKLDFDEVFYPNKKYLPIPVDREVFPFKLREKAETFVFNNGHGGYMDRNGASELFQAISLIKKDIKFLIRSQVYFPSVINDSRVEIVYGDIPIEELYEKGDVFLFPHKFDGLSLPIQEALSSGFPIISTNIYPHNTYLPKEWLFEPETITKTYIKREMDIAIINSVKLAQKIEEWTDKDIKKESQKANEIAEKLSWEKLKDKYLEVIQNVF